MDAIKEIIHFLVQEKVIVPVFLITVVCVVISSVFCDPE